MSSFAGAERRQKRKSKLKSMMSRKSIDKKEADKIKQLMVREAINLQVQAKVEGNADTAPADEGGERLRAMLKRKSLTPEEALLVKQMMMKEASNSSTSNISTSNERRNDTTVNTATGKSDPTIRLIVCHRRAKHSIREIACQRKHPTTPARKHRSSKVLFDYVSQNVDELDIAVGETVEILDKQSDGWYRVRKTSDKQYCTGGLVQEII